MKETGSKHLFFDINKLPISEGVILFGISMSRIGNTQSPKKCFEYLTHLASKIQHTDGIGMVMCYSDYLYFNSDDPAHTLRDRCTSLMVSHKNAFLNLLKKDRKWTHKAFSFTTFGQLLLDNADIYERAYKKVLELYKRDAAFRACVEEDGKDTGHGVGEREARFILEEITLFYLSQKGVFRLGNRFVTDAEKTWTLQAYPGTYLKSEVYVFRNNPLDLSNPKNVYEHSFYDLEKNVLVNYDKIRLEI